MDVYEVVKLHLFIHKNLFGTQHTVGIKLRSGDKYIVSALKNLTVWN